MTEQIKRFVESKPFQYGILALIVAAAVLAGFETSENVTRRHAGLFEVLNHLVIWAFVAEAVLKMAQYGTKFYRYFLDPWNVADFIITVLCVLPVVVDLPIDVGFAAVLRLARVVRALRLITTVPRLQLIVNSMIKSIPSMLYVGILLFLIFYIYGVMGVHLFRENDPVHFRDLPRAMLTLFRIVTLEEWTAIMDTQLLGSEVFTDYNELGANSKFSRTPVPHPIVAPLYFISFIFFGTMVMLNLFIGIIVGSMSEAQDESAKQHLKEVEESGLGPTVDDDLLAMQTGLDDLNAQFQKLRLRLESRAEARTAQEVI